MADELNRARQYATRVAVLDADVFLELANDPSITRLALIVPAAVSFAAALGSLFAEFWWGGAGHSLLNFFVRQMLLGSLCGWAAWGLWVITTRTLLSRARIEVDLERLARAMGFAMLPFGLLLLMVIPEVAGGIFRFNNFAASVVGAVAVLVPVWARTAVREVAPGATERTITIAVLGGYLVAIALLGLLGSHAGIAPGYSVFLRGDSFL